MLKRLLILLLVVGIEFFPELDDPEHRDWKCNNEKKADDKDYCDQPRAQIGVIIKAVSTIGVAITH